MANKFYEMLLSHRIPVTSLYRGAQGMWSWNSSETLRKLWARGQRTWNLATLGRNTLYPNKTRAGSEVIQSRLSWTHSSRK